MTYVTVMYENHLDFLFICLQTDLMCRGCPGKKIQAKVPKRIHKAVREKRKREHINDLFLELSDALGNFDYPYDIPYDFTLLQFILYS